MPKGKGYFWSGLAKGLSGMYGMNQNERMAKQANEFSAGEAEKDRGFRTSQFDRMFPPKPAADTLNPDLDSAIKLADSAAAELARINKQIGEVSLVDPKMAAALKPQQDAAIVQAQRAKAAADALQSKTLSRQGAVVQKPKDTSADDEFMRKLFE